MATDRVSLKIPAAFHGASEESFPSWMLLEVYGYFEKVENATTAVAKTSDHKHIQITFCPRPPPLISRFYIHSPDGASIHQVPQIVAIEDDLAVLRVDLVPCGVYLDHYVYQADDGSGKPSLTLLPRTPSNFCFHSKDIGILGYRRPGSTRKEYILAVFRFIQFGFSDDVGFQLCIYDSKLADWKAYALSLSPQVQQEYGDKTFLHKNCKVVTIGGDAGTMALVDLWRGMLLCDVLHVEREAARQAQGKAIPLLGYLSLPDDLERNGKLKGDARLYRDIAFLDGHLKCVDLASRSLWIRPATAGFSTGGWSQRYSIRTFREITDSNPGINLLPGRKGVNCRSFRGLLLCQPVIGLEDDDARILYFTVKMHQEDDQASVVAVDMVSKKILGVAHFFQRFEMINFTYVHSRLFRHLKKTGPGAQANLKQSGIGMVLQGSSSKMKDAAQEQHDTERLAEYGDAMALE